MKTSSNRDLAEEAATTIEVNALRGDELRSYLVAWLKDVRRDDRSRRDELLLLRGATLDALGDQALALAVEQVDAQLASERSGT